MTQQQYPGQFSQSTRSEGEGASSGRSGEFSRFRSSLPRRSREHRILGGVCGGLAEAWGMPVTAVRVGVILASFLPGPMFLVYVGAWCLMLDEPAPAQYCLIGAAPASSPPVPRVTRRAQCVAGRVRHDAPSAHPGRDTRAAVSREGAVDGRIEP